MDGWLGFLEKANDPDHPADELRERKSHASGFDTTMPLSTFATIGHLISVVKHSPKVRKLLGETDRVAKQLQSLPHLRNRVAHAVKPIVAGPLHIKTVAREVELMFEWIDRWETHWNKGPSGSS